MKSIWDDQNMVTVYKIEQIFVEVYLPWSIKFPFNQLFTLKEAGKPLSPLWHTKQILIFFCID